LLNGTISSLDTCVLIYTHTHTYKYTYKSTYIHTYTGGAITKVAGSVFGGSMDNHASSYKKNESAGPVETGPTSIQIQLEKNSDDSDEEDESERKQQVC
jgi:hypothetical protein